MHNNNDFMEDISSSSKEADSDKGIEKAVNTYGGFIYKHLAKVIKSIAYVVAFANLIFGFIAAAFVFKLKFAYIALSFFAILVFAVIAAVAFFVIYGIGHSIDQNNEILKKLS